MAAINGTMAVEIDCRAIELKHGDRLLVECPHMLTAAQLEYTRKALMDWAGVPAESILILQNGGKLRVLSKENTDNACTGNP